MERTEQLAEAYKKIAEADHYMVGLVAPVTIEERAGAKEILINQQNRLAHAGRGHSSRYRLLGRALDVLEHDEQQDDDLPGDLGRWDDADGVTEGGR